MRAIAVVGSAWGDEGKGAATDALTAVSESPLVIRHNGGGQAGHTVITPDGRRHVFSHFCSGALAGAPSYLSEFFIVNPRTFLVERLELEALGANLNIGVHPKAMVTTPLDVALNRAIETKRGSARHGSVGVGFGETIERNERGFPLLVEDLVGTPLTKGNLNVIVNRILTEWLPIRETELGVHIDLTQINWADFFGECTHFVDHICISTIKEASKGHQTIIFEGAQGLLLDQKRGMTFPYVTRSNTGLQNVVPLMGQLGLKNLRAIYMMRTYLTRHGAGPLPGELTYKMPNIVDDKTNVTGPWQGSLRLAPMDPNLVIDSINADLNDVRGISVEPHIGISCADQGMNQRMTDIIVAFPVAVMGHGPSRNRYCISSKFKAKKPVQDKPIKEVV